MKSKNLIRGLLFFATSFLFSCATSRFVNPLEKGKNAFGFSFGGPLIKFAGAPIPIPFTTLVYAHGLSDKITGYGGLHTTSLMFGNLQSDLGCTFRIFQKENVLGISASPALQLAYNLRNKTGFRLWPSFDINAYYPIKNSKSYIYGGVNGWFELTSKKAFNEKQNQHVMPNIHLGYTHAKKKWVNQFELKYLGIGAAIFPGVVDYISLSGKGTFGIYYSLIRTF